MNQSELNRAVARATGETTDTIARMGFSRLLGGPFEREPRTVDWDDYNRSRHVAVSRARQPRPAA